MDINNIHQFFEKLTVLPILEKVRELKEELDKARPIKKEDEDRIWQKFRLDWNFHSNHLEGNSLTFGETKLLILHGLTAQGKPLKDHFEVTGHNDAIDWILEVIQQERPLTESFIRELHALILKEPYEVDALTAEGLPTKKKIQIGVYKTTPNHVKTKTGEIFRFATPEETPAKMNDLMVWYQEKVSNPETNPIVLAADFHYTFVRIHPFDDGNGRMSRLLMNFILMQFGYPPVVVRTEDKENYLNTLRQADAGMYESFVEYIAENLIQSLEIMHKGAKGESLEEPGDLEKEILLLEQRVKSSDNYVKVVKSKESILEVYDNSITNLLLKIEEKNKLFEKFYVDIKSSIRIPHNDFFVTLNRDKIDTKTSLIIISSGFGNFRSYKIKEYIFSYNITFNFNHKHYTIQDSQDNIKLEKTYHQQLTEEEIEEIVNAEVRRHKEFIAEKIKEIENPKNK